MTDNEIIKALECCINWGGITSCADCPIHDTGCIHFDKLQETLDLINRQKEEIEILKNIGDNKTKELLRYDGFIRELHDKLKAAKAEAIKEYTKKLEAKLFPMGLVDNGNYSINAKAIKVVIAKVKDEVLKDESKTNSR